MTTIGDHNSASTAQLSNALSPQVSATNMAGEAKASALRSSFRQNGKSSEKLKETFTQFVGETFYGQMIKSMRSTVGKPAYFHGGRGEDVFQGQLDQQMAQHLTEATAAKFATPLFERQFPQFAERPQHQELNELAQLRRR